ncbi:GP46 domain protein [Burkholderia multivorans]|uniref:Lar family restriction alleviation protein n=1 Tax=Burkholderia multivorans TaxID=87883 RepID=UPI00050EBCE7|nr:Lar family restriction alleviation protein [Burkholderia multivorans]KGB98081.1 GP46 domain protein [Burkholderia multivorans]
MNTICKSRIDSAAELLPCPFCGGTDPEIWNTHTPSFTVQCTVCDAEATGEHFPTPTGTVREDRFHYSPTPDDTGFEAAFDDLHPEYKEAFRSAVDAWNRRAAPHVDRLGAAPINDASVAAIQYALDAEHGLEWLALWNEGEFDRCRRGWPDAPEDCYIGADPLHPGTQRLLAAQAAEVDVRVERRRQVEEKGWTVEHDDKHACGEIAALATYYAMPAGVREWTATHTGYGVTFGQAILPDGWSAKIGDDRRRELVKAGALILVEIERIDRDPGDESHHGHLNGGSL